MMSNWKMQPSLSYLPAILLVGIGLGIGTYSLGFDANLWHLIILHSLTSLCIGFPLIMVASNQEWFEQRIIHPVYRILALVGLFISIGLLATEIEWFFRVLLKDQLSNYRPFVSNSSLFNAIISTVLGVSYYFHLHPPKPLAQEVEEAIIEEASSPLEAIPIKKSGGIHLLAPHRIALIEAYDKYAYVYEEDGSKSLCDYSLSFLEKRLPADFLRVHRKYILNKKHIKLIRPFDKNHYLIEFRSTDIPPIKNGQTYLASVKSLVRL